MKKIILTSLVLFFAGWTALAGTNKPSANAAATVSKAENNCICGKIVDKNSAEALAGVAVQYNDNKVYTDLDGKFSIPKSQLNENVKLTIRMISYEETEVQINLKSDEEMNIALSQR